MERHINYIYSLTIQLLGFLKDQILIDLEVLDLDLKEIDLSMVLFSQDPGITLYLCSISSNTISDTPVHLFQRI